MRSDIFYCDLCPAVDRERFAAYHVVGSRSVGKDGDEAGEVVIFEAATNAMDCCQQHLPAAMAKMFGDNEVNEVTVTRTGKAIKNRALRNVGQPSATLRAERPEA